MKHHYEDQNKKGVYFSRFMDTVGDATGTVEQAVNGSVTPVEFCVTAPSGYAYIVHALTITYAVTGKLDSGGYGNGSALTNGVAVYEKNPDGSVKRDATFQLPIKSNVTWSAYSFNSSSLTFGSGDESLSFKYDFIDDSAPIVLSPGQSYCLKVQDDLSAVCNNHYARVGMVKVKV